MTTNNYQIQFITHYNERLSYIDSARIALEGGCKWIQLRMKDADELLLEETALVVQKICKAYEATFIIDDNVLLAQKIGADGVHLGKNDMPIAEARKILGEACIIGCTVNSFEDIIRTIRSAIPDYWGCGPFRFTSTKKNLAPILGCEGYREITQKMRDNNINIPLIAIGGIHKEDITDLLRCGADGVAMSSSVINNSNPIQEMRDIVEIFKQRARNDL